MKKKKYNKTILIKYLVNTLGSLAVLLVFYLIFLPLYPEVKYKINYNKSENNIKSKDITKAKQSTSEIIKYLPNSEYAISPNRVIIKKIGVNTPIIQTDNEEYGLSLGAWLMPGGSTPDKGGNTIITGHRFKYLPPSNLTFYLLNKLEVGDIISVIWDEKNYFYRVEEVRVVEKTDISILESQKDSILTIFTCHPIYSTKQRLVVVSELIKED